MGLECVGGTRSQKKSAHIGEFLLSQGAADFAGFKDVKKRIIWGQGEGN